MSLSETLPHDGTLIAAVLAGDRESFAHLVSRYEGPLLRLAKSRLGRLDWAEDVVQETFLCAYRWLHTYDSKYSFRTWLWTILLNQCHRHFEKRQRQPASTQPSNAARPGKEPVCGAALPEETLLAKERSQELAAVLAQLPPAEADALRLRFFGGLKFQEIADALGCSLTSAKNRVRFGLVKMAERMNAAPPVSS
ncbi:MAG TPA: RNA polymerase sigma factor [Pirellulaceae bacterium]|nr:RNA polymerase sigma factor [Pirellulaceae bacterium]